MLHVVICCKLLASQLLLQGFKETELAGHEIGTAERVVYNLPAVNPAQIRSSVYSMGPSGFHVWFLKKRVAGNRSQQKPTKIKVSPPGYSHFVPIFLNAGTRSLVPSWEKCLLSMVTTKRPDVYHLLLT